MLQVCQHFYQEIVVAASQQCMHRERDEPNDISSKSESTNPKKEAKP